ncbi:hypothetical protein ASPVEDRAFT_49452 [Aspergillus versicolor CBS 583.65]|uniref:Ubiquitin-like protein smt3 n=1 Tax=Aspergillus versicolor CBS 583.65 TaxID=1036611 RepID=A0A1L9P7F2_ASPVE|nr:uncharacterized protein ASPVEDRAFT_49452 [Aspergillus versicolor CBS 583.65]OJI97445.1 hypothetical protein ASPVEDRAFT_49452 [Aspergillus versicolor CBS 583.65]
MPTAASPSPTSAATATSELQSSLRELHIGEKTSSIPDIPRPKITTASLNTAAPVPKKKKAPVVVDSWEDELDESSPTESAQGEVDPGSATSNFAESDTSLGTSPAVAEGPLDPPPTPISPQTSRPWVAATGGYGGPASRSRSTSAPRDPNRRPEKQTAVAGRLIAGALGIRAPKRTEEQRAYDRSVKEQEIRRRNKEREEAAKLKEEEEKVKASVWDD